MECNDSWTFFFGNLQGMVPDSLELCIISDHASSIAKGILRVYSQAHH